MDTIRVVKTLTILGLLLCAAAGTRVQAQETPPPPAAKPAEAPPADGAWLDATPVVAWNQQGAAVPKAPEIEGESLVTGRCADQSRPPETPADRALTAAGWTLVGPLQVFGETSLAGGAVAGDGMCRPLGYQVFVFVRGRFAGTVSPHPMNARTDGIANTAHLLSRDRVMVEFARYAKEDPLCCPSRQSQVTFAVKRSPGGSTLVVESVQTSPTPAR